VQKPQEVLYFFLSEFFALRKGTSHSVETSVTLRQSTKRHFLGTDEFAATDCEKLKLLLLLFC
jgi:hypothetical protein